jgi:hypothetical protein
VDESFLVFGADQFPLSGDHAFQTDALGGGLGLPLGFEVVTELVEFLLGFPGEDELTGTEAMLKGVQADGGLACFRDRAMTFQSIFAVGGYLVFSSHKN